MENSEKINAKIVLPWTRNEMRETEEQIREKVLEQIRTIRPHKIKIQVRLKDQVVIVIFDRIPSNKSEYVINLEYKDVPSIQSRKNPPSNRVPDSLKPGEAALSESEAKFYSEKWYLPYDGWKENWDSIFLEGDLKERINNYLIMWESMIETELSKVSTALHRIIILYGPPGTGKTSLARGIANQLADRFGPMQHSIYLEMNPHKVWSKWEGESGQFVQKAFQVAHEVAQSGHPTILLFDEVESILTQRGLSANDANPVDVFKAVNAALQEIDRLANQTNILTIATTNLPMAIDDAFFDRADLIFYIGVPDAQTRERIIKDTLSAYHKEFHFKYINLDEPNPEWKKLIECTDGFSGRQLRKLVLQARTIRESTAKNPEDLKLDDLIHAAEVYRAQRKENISKQGRFDSFDNLDETNIKKQQGQTETSLFRLLQKASRSAPSNRRSMKRK